jgi:hypothetical protein
MYTLCPKINNFLIFFRQIKDAGKRSMYPHLLSFPRWYLQDLASIIYMHPWFRIKT